MICLPVLPSNATYHCVITGALLIALSSNPNAKQLRRQWDDMHSRDLEGSDGDAELT